MHAERVLMGCSRSTTGDVRLTLLHIPSRNVYGTQLGTIRTGRSDHARLSQALFPAGGERRDDRGHRPHAAHALAQRPVRAAARADADFAAAEEELRIAEDHAVVMTPLMARSGWPVAAQPSPATGDGFVPAARTVPERAAAPKVGSRWRVQP